MKQVTLDFGSDHVWQMDGFFAGGSGWGADAPSGDALAPVPAQVPCKWSAAINNTYLVGYIHSGPLSFPTLVEAKAACLEPANIESCGGVVSRHGGTGPFELRAGTKPVPVPAADGEASYTLVNSAACKPAHSTVIWRNRSAAAYSAVTRVDGMATLIIINIIKMAC